MRVIGVCDCRRRRPQVGCDRQHGRGGAGRPHLYRAGQPSLPRRRRSTGPIPRRAGARDLAGLAVAARIRDLREVHRRRCRDVRLTAVTGLGPVLEIAHVRPHPAAISLHPATSSLSAPRATILSFHSETTLTVTRATHHLQFEDPNPALGDGQCGFSYRVARRCGRLRG
jgi:hypothetical protein